MVRTDMANELRIGSKLYGHDRWNRGRERIFTIVGETKQSWLISSYHTPETFKPDSSRVEYKLPKRKCVGNEAIYADDGRGFGTYLFLSQEAYELTMWCDRNRHKIMEKLNLATAEKLKEVAAILGYEEGK